MEYVKKITHSISSIIFVLIFIYVIVWVPSVFGYKPLIVLSGSMEPTYKKQSVIYYKKVEREDIKIGDIITFKGNKNELISHRIVDIENGLFTTKGDANKVNDIDKINYDDIYGKNVNLNIVYVGYYINFVNTHTYLVVIACLILIIDFILSNYKEEKNEK